MQRYAKFLSHNGQLVEIIATSTAKHIVKAQHQSLGSKPLNQHLPEELASRHVRQSGREFYFYHSINPTGGEQFAPLIVGGDSEMRRHISGQHLTGVSVESHRHRL